MKARIYKPTNSAMQSGKARSRKWLFEVIEEKNIRHLDPLMSWVSVDNTLSELHFEFAHKEEAIDFAKRSGFEFVVEEPLAPKLQKKSYAENFA